MIDMTGNIEAAAARARTALGDAAARAATASTGPAAARDFEEPMKESVRKELFTEALLGAAHSRFEEIKTAADGSR